MNYNFDYLKRLENTYTLRKIGGKYFAQSKVSGLMMSPSLVEDLKFATAWKKASNAAKSAQRASKARTLEASDESVERNVYRVLVHLEAVYLQTKGRLADLSTAVQVVTTNTDSYFFGPSLVSVLYSEDYKPVLESWVRKAYGIQVCQEKDEAALGNSRLGTTSIHPHASNEELRSVYLNSHPRAHKK